MSTLTVLLPARDVHATAQTWSLPDLRFELVDRRGRRLQAGVAPLALLPKASTTVLIVAARDVLLIDAVVPPLAGPRLRQALPNIVEDYLLPDGPPQHLALSPAPAGARKAAAMRTVAAIDRGWLRFVHEAFAAAGHTTIRAVPLVACLPLVDARETVLLIEPDGTSPETGTAAGQTPAAENKRGADRASALIDLAVRRHPSAIAARAPTPVAAPAPADARIAGEGMAVPADALVGVLDMLFPETSEAVPFVTSEFTADRDASGQRSGLQRVDIYRLDAKMPSMSQVDPLPANRSARASTMASSSVERVLRHREVDIRVLDFDSLGAAARQSAFDLCQFEFAARPWRLRPGLLRQLRLPLILLAASVAVAVVGINVQWAQLAHARNLVQARMTDLLLEAFPRTTVVLDPPTQMSRSLDALRVSAGELSPDDFLSLTNGLAASMGAIPADAIESLDYDRQTLQLAFRPDAKIDSGFQDRLARHGLSAQYDGKRWAIRSSR